ncbi:MAG: RdgB/HAM1 family non-canonical purine NTP pyrophosphatase [Piscirickettsiaceae bacterium]|jgi:XTP/dITP diphosphohydrolase|nr:RdgB/HAM1 family non-canonical purine NTP pyrophosphatase [Piscirickettsiaceae bacterium]
MSKIVLASGNAGKLREFSQLLRDMNTEVIPQSAFNLIEAEETGLTFVENAIIKARHACLQTGLPAIADDSGIEVDALNGEPGIYSARYSGPNATAQKNCDALLNALINTPEAKRTARYQCVIVFMRHAKDPTPIICQADWQGHILAEPKGDGGFGYDPLFWVEQHQCTAAELSPEQKHAISHRGKAIRQFITLFQQQYTP